MSFLRALLSSHLPLASLPSLRPPFPLAFFHTPFTPPSDTPSPSLSSPVIAAQMVTCHGPQRSSDVTFLSGHDLVLTTYATLASDVVRCMGCMGCMGQFALTLCQIASKACLPLDTCLGCPCSAHWLLCLYITVWHGQDLSLSMGTHMLARAVSFLPAEAGKGEGPAQCQLAPCDPRRGACKCAFAST